MKSGPAAVIAVLVAILIATGVFAVLAWQSAGGDPMPTTGFVAMGLGIVFTLVVGCGLMFLVFYSNRMGYDDLSRYSDNDASPGPSARDRSRPH